MDNYEFENTENEENISGNCGDLSWKVFIGTAVLGAGTSICLLVKNFFLKNELKEEREKNVAYQELLRIHEAEINELKKDKDRRVYKERLWSLIQADMEG